MYILLELCVVLGNSGNVYTVYIYSELVYVTLTLDNSAGGPYSRNTGMGASLIKAKQAVRLTPYSIHTCIHVTMT